MYLCVCDAEALHAEWTSGGGEGRFIGPHTPYGLREFVSIPTPTGWCIRSARRLNQVRVAREPRPDIGGSRGIWGVSHSAGSETFFEHDGC